MNENIQGLLFGPVAEQYLILRKRFQSLDEVVGDIVDVNAQQPIPSILALLNFVVDVVSLGSLFTNEYCGDRRVVPASPTRPNRTSAPEPGSQADRPRCLLRHHRQRASTPEVHWADQEVWRAWLNRRGGRTRMGWERFDRLIGRYPHPVARVIRMARKARAASP